MYKKPSQNLRNDFHEDFLCAFLTGVWFYISGANILSTCPARRLNTL